MAGWLAHTSNLTGSLDAIRYVGSRVDLSALTIIISISPSKLPSISRKPMSCNSASHLSSGAVRTAEILATNSRKGPLFLTPSYIPGLDSQLPLLPWQPLTWESPVDFRRLMWAVSGGCAGVPDAWYPFTVGTETQLRCCGGHRQAPSTSGHSSPLSPT